MANMSFGVNILPKTNNAYTLGNSDYKWNIFANQINGTNISDIISNSSDVSNKVDKTALLNAGITATTYTTLFDGEFSVTTATDNDHTVPYAKSSKTGTLNKHKRHRVTFNGTEYILETRIWYLSNKFYYYLGDISKIYAHPEYVPGGNDSSLPFLITFDRDNSTSVEVWTTTAGTYTIKIEMINDTFKTLPIELMYGGAYPPILQSDNAYSTFNGYSIGVNALANKRGTIGIGYGNFITEDFGVALGLNHEVHGEFSTALGINNIVVSEDSTGLGVYNIIESGCDRSLTIGGTNHIFSNSVCCMTIGHQNTVNSYSPYGYAIGYWNIHYGTNTYSFGYSNTVFTDNTMALGNAASATGKYQLSLGTFNVLDKPNDWIASTSYAVGDKVYKNNRWYECKTANSDATFTESNWTRCKGKFVEILGNGDLDSSPTVRSNARATDWAGNTYIKGDVYVGCNADSSGGTKLATISQLPSTLVGATSQAAGTSGLVPAPTTSDTDKFLAGDGTWKSGGKPMVILSYGNSTWQNFIDAYNSNVIVYCRASSNSNPGTGTQGRMAFMAFINFNNSGNPTSVEFQYYRSVSSHSSTQMSDQVFIYKLDNSTGWSVTTREAGIKKVVAGTGTSVSYSSNEVTVSTANYGSNNAGKFLIVGDDGNITTSTILAAEEVSF